MLWCCFRLYKFVKSEDYFSFHNLKSIFLWAFIVILIHLLVYYFRCFRLTATCILSDTQRQHSIKQLRLLNKPAAHTLVSTLINFQPFLNSETQSVSIIHISIVQSLKREKWSVSLPNNISETTESNQIWFWSHLSTEPFKHAIKSLEFKTIFQ